MEQNPMPATSSEPKPLEKSTPTKAQLWLLLGALVIGVVCEIMTEQDACSWYSAFWLTALAVFAAFNFRRMASNSTVIALAVPALVLCGVLMFDYINEELLGFTILAIPALLLTIGVFATQEIACKHEGKAVVGVLRAVFVKPFTAIGAYFRAYAGVFRAKERSTARHVGLGLAIGIPLTAVVLALLASADAGMAELLGGVFERFSLGRWVGRALVVFLASMLFYSLFFNLTWGKKDADMAPVRQNWKVSGPGVVVSLLLLAYALFTYVQFTYLFGGSLPVDLTYSEYAREGFGQLLAVTLINFTVLGVSLAKSEPKCAIRVLESFLILASLVVLASAAWRMLLYVGAYGLTIRRVLPLWLMVYFVFLAGVGAVRVYREKTPFLRIGAFALIYWYAAFVCVDWNTLMHAYNLAHGFGA